MIAFVGCMNGTKGNPTARNTTGGRGVRQIDWGGSWDHGTRHGKAFQCGDGGNMPPHSNFLLYLFCPISSPVFPVHTVIAPGVLCCNIKHLLLHRFWGCSGRDPQMPGSWRRDHLQPRPTSSQTPETQMGLWRTRRQIFGPPFEHGDSANPPHPRRTTPTLPVKRTQRSDCRLSDTLAV